MKLTVFAKKRTTKEGKPFYTYLSTLHKKDGTDITVQLKFQDACGNPKAEDCPMNIEVDKVMANFSTKTREVADPETGEIHEYVDNKLWIKDWEKSKDIYVDKSLDEFDFSD